VDLVPLTQMCDHLEGSKESIKKYFKILRDMTFHKNSIVKKPLL
jgi:hypothetical protein